jgi:hypothetical protein
MAVLAGCLVIPESFAVSVGNTMQVLSRSLDSRPDQQKARQEWLQAVVEGGGIFPSAAVVDADNAADAPSSRHLDYSNFLDRDVSRKAGYVACFAQDRQSETVTDVLPACQTFPPAGKAWLGPSPLFLPGQVAARWVSGWERVPLEEEPQLAGAVVISL